MSGAGGGRRHALRTQRIVDPNALGGIVFEDGIASVTASLRALSAARWKNDVRQESPRLAAVRRSIRSRGYVALDPIICRIGAKGRWIVVDGGHRLTAARQVEREWWSNLFGRKVGDLYFLLFTTPRSWSKVRAAAPQPLPETPPPEALALD